MTSDHYLEPNSGGGVERVIYEVGRRLVERGHEVTVLTLAEPAQCEPSVDAGMRIERLPGVRLNRLVGLEVRQRLFPATRLETLLRTVRPHVVNAHHPLFSTTPVVLATASRLGIPTVLSLHIGDLNALRGWKGVAARGFARRATRRAVANATKVIAVSDNVRQAHCVEAEVVYNGVDIDRFHPPCGKERAGNRVVFVGRLIANKGPQILLQAFNSVLAEAPDSLLTFVGDGPMRSQLEKQARDDGTAHAVHFAGMTSDVAMHLRQSDIFARPSLTEGFPLTVLEAMACGLPVVATDVGGVREIVEDGRTGFLVAPGEFEPVTRALLELLLDTSLRCRMGDAGQKAVEEGFNWDETARATEASLAQVVTG